MSSTDCSCVYVPIDDVLPAFSCATRRSARKIHQCDECNREIHVGETYERVAGKWDGYMETHLTCLDCVSILDAMFCDGCVYGELFPYLREHLQAVGGRVAADCLVKMTPAARAVVCKMAIESEPEDGEK